MIFSSSYKLLEYFAYYAGIMLNALACLLCLKLCWHNQRKPAIENREDIRGGSRIF